MSEVNGSTGSFSDHFLITEIPLATCIKFRFPDCLKSKNSEKPW